MHTHFISLGGPKLPVDACPLIHRLPFLDRGSERTSDRPLLRTNSYSTPKWWISSQVVKGFQRLNWCILLMSSPYVEEINCVCAERVGQDRESPVILGQHHALDIRGNHPWDHEIHLLPHPVVGDVYWHNLIFRRGCKESFGLGHLYDGLGDIHKLEIAARTSLDWEPIWADPVYVQNYRVWLVSLTPELEERVAAYWELSRVHEGVILAKFD